MHSSFPAIAAASRTSSNQYSPVRLERVYVRNAVQSPIVSYDMHGRNAGAVIAGKQLGVHNTGEQLQNQQNRKGPAFLEPSGLVPGGFFVISVV